MVSLAQMETEMKKKVLDSQSLWDIALQESGDVTQVFEMAESEGISLTDELPVGQEIEIPVEPGNRALADYYSVNGIRPATAIAASLLEGEGALWQEGIEFWELELYFVIN